MSTTPIVPCLWFDDQAEEVASFYAQAFGDGRTTAVTHYPKTKDNPSGKPPGSVLTVEFEIHGQRFVGLNGGPYFKIGPNISFFARVEFGNDAERLFNALSVGGQVLMALDKYPWSELYGWVQDRFGVSWQVITGAREPGSDVIVPCLMFSGPQHRRAAEAMEFYMKVFPDSRSIDVTRYAASEASHGAEGTVKHGRFVIAGKEMIAMDSHLEHGTTFNEAVSLQVMCTRQAEVDRYWALLSEGGEESRCGWLKDRFGVSWQIVPEAMTGWLTSSDKAAQQRVFETMLPMSKLDLAALQAAFDGR